MTDGQDHNTKASASEQLAALLAHSSEAVLVLDQDLRICWMSPSASSWSLKPAWNPGVHFIDIPIEADRDLLRVALRRIDPSDAVEVRVAATGPERCIEFRLSRAAGLHGGEIIVNARDVTYLRSVERQLFHERHHDPLTNLPTRGVFTDHTNRALVRGRRRGWATAVVVVDVDRFHRLNQDFGWETGDALLVETAARIQQVLRSADVVARSVTAVSRLAGDEFLVLCEEVHHRGAARRVARRVLDAIAAPVPVASEFVSIAASAGVALAGDGDDADTLIARAQAALPHAKAADDSIEVFTAATDSSGGGDVLAADLRTALEEGQLRLVYQPKVSLATDRIVGFEAQGRRLGASTPDRASRASEIVLVCDDAADIRQLARMALTAAGFIVEEASTGADSLAIARRLRPDCVVLDVDFPDMNGFEVVSKLRDDPRAADATIVMLTAHADAADKARAFSFGADDYIVKPFSPRDLVARITSATRRRSGGEHYA